MSDTQLRDRLTVIVAGLPEATRTGEQEALVTGDPARFYAPAPAQATNLRARATTSRAQPHDRLTPVPLCP